VHDKNEVITMKTVYDMMNLDDLKTSMAAFISLVSAGIGTGIDLLNDLCFLPFISVNISVLDKILQEIA
jgi:hypothetical protein